MSRAHCKIDAGPLAVLVTDLGSSKGTRLDSMEGKKITAKIIMPGQVCVSAFGRDAQHRSPYLGGVGWSCQALPPTHHGLS